jgi:hypothetical protein
MGGEDVGLLPFVDERVDFGRDEFLQDAAGFVVVGGEEHFSDLTPAMLLVSPSCPGLVPGIHVLVAKKKKDVDGRDKPSHDNGRLSQPHLP